MRLAQRNNLRGKVCGEIVLDATAAKRDGLDSILLLRYPKKFAHKHFDDSLQKFRKKIRIQSFSFGNRI